MVHRHLSSIHLTHNALGITPLSRTAAAKTLCAASSPEESLLLQFDMYTMALIRTIKRKSKRCVSVQKLLPTIGPDRWNLILAVVKATLTVQPTSTATVPKSDPFCQMWNSKTEVVFVYRYSYVAFVLDCCALANPSACSQTKFKMAAQRSLHLHVA